MKETKMISDGAVSRRGIITGAPSLLLVGALAAPAILTPDVAHASSAIRTMTIYWSDIHKVTLGSTATQVNATGRFTQFKSVKSNGIISHTVFVRYQGHHNLSGLMNYQVWGNGSRARNLCWQRLPSSITTMSSLPGSYERAHPSRIGIETLTNSERDLRGVSGTPSGMTNTTFRATVSTTKDNQTWIRRYTHNTSGKTFYLFSDHYTAGGQHEWRYVIANDLSAAVATRFYAMKDAERDLFTANWELAGGVFGGSLATAAAIVVEVGTAGASTAPSTALLVGSLAAVAAAGENREQKIDALVEKHDRYDSHFENRFSSSNTSGYLTKSSSSNSFNSAFAALNIT